MRTASPKYSSMTIGTAAEVAASPWLTFLVLHFMAKSEKILSKKRRGRPATGRDPVTAIRLSSDLREKVDAWAAKQKDAPRRSEAIRRLVEHGLTARVPPRRSSDKQKARAKELAGSAIDKLTEFAASTDDKLSRKRRLIKGPEEFREARVDRRERKT
jgi:hypothetical protein